MPGGNISRRSVLKMSGLAVASSIAGCVGGIGGSGEDFNPMDMTSEQFKNPSNVDYESQFNMWNWYDGFADYTKNKLPKDYSNLEQVTTSGYSSPTQWMSKLQSGNHDMDNIGGTTQYTKPAIDSNLLSPIPVEEMPNWQHIPDWYKTKYEKYFSKDGEMYAVPESRGINPILAYNSDEFDEPPKSWDILWDEEYKGKLTIQNDPINACELAALYLGQDPYNPSDFKEIKEALIQQKPLMKTYWEDYTTGMRLFVNESCVAGTLTAGRVVDARFNNNAPHVDYTVPKEGAPVFSDHYILPKEAPHPKISTLFMNWAMAPENAIRLFLTMGYLPPLKNAEEQMKKAGVSQEKIDFVTWPDDWNIKFSPPVSDEVRNRYSQIWTEVKAA